MVEKLIDFIGRLLSSIFRKSNDIIDNTKTEFGMMKEQVKVVRVNTQSTLSVSVSGENHVNYFRNRVVGEFLKVMSSLVVYKYEQSSGKHVAYFVRHKRKLVMEYIKFSKDRIDDTEATISYTFINKVISSIGVTTHIGRTDKKVLVVDDAISTCIYDSISGKKAPLYLVHVLDNKVGIGNPTFVLDCWLITTKLINKKVNSYVLNSDGKDGKLIETLMYQAGIHMYMSYFRSLQNPYYRTVYGTSPINSIVEAIKDYNSRHFNTNKILNFSFDYTNKGGIKVEVDPSKQFTILSLYGVSIKFTGVITDQGENAARRFNYKFAESLIKSEDAELRLNFLFYMFSTGGIDDEDIVRLNEESEFEGSKGSDKDLAYLNQRIEPVVKQVMSDSKFTETEDGDLASRDFEEFIKQDVKEKFSSEVIIIPTVTDVGVTYIDSPKSTTPIGGSVEELRSESQNMEEVSATTEDYVESSISSDFVQRLEAQATGQATVTRQEDVVTKLESVVVDNSKSIGELLKTPLTQWTSEDCMKVLGSDESLNANITRQDVLERMMFLSSKGTV